MSIHRQMALLKECRAGGPRVVVSTAALHARVRGSVSSLGGLKKKKRFFPIHVGSLCSTSDRQGSNFESCVWRTVSSHSSHHPQEVLLTQFSLHVHKGGLKPDSFHFICMLTNMSVFPRVNLDARKRQTSASLTLGTLNSLYFL